MHRKSTFEDFEKLIDEQIPATGSEFFEEPDTEEPAAQEPVKKVSADKDAPRRKVTSSEDARAELARRIAAREAAAKKAAEEEASLNNTYSENTSDDELTAEERYRRRRQMLQERAQQQKQSSHTGGRILVGVQLLLSAILLILLIMFDVLPLRYFIAVIVVLLLLAGLSYRLQKVRRLRLFGKALPVVLSAVLLIGNVYLARTMIMLNNVTGGKDYQTDKIAVAVLNEDPAKSIDDMKSYNFGIMKALDRTKVDVAIDNMNNHLKTSIPLTEYNTYSEQVQALYHGTVQAIIYNQALDELIEDNNPGFLERIRVVKVYDVKTEMFMGDVPDLPITQEPFVVYLSGMDAYGELEQTSNSDVNIVACVHPETKQILLISIPRDGYVSIPGVTSMGEKDKLTHAGLYGLPYSIAALENLLDIDISYYARVNFSSLILMVDALGGIDVESEYSFSTYYKQYIPETDTWTYYQYNKGMNHLDGVHALAFARERMNAAGGDYQRARNQQKIIAALLDKIKSPAVLTGYTGLLASLEGHMDTNLTAQQLASLVKMQLNDGADWNIVSSSIYGYGSDEYCYTYPDLVLSVEILDEDSIAAVKEVIKDLMDGKVISEPRQTEIEKAYQNYEMDMNSDYYINNHAEDYEYDDFYWEHGGNLTEQERSTMGSNPNINNTVPDSEDEPYEEDYFYDDDEDGDY